MRLLLSVLLLLASVLAAPGEPCVSDSGESGVCQTSAQCTGTASSTCPDEGLVCCSAACAGDGFSGTCRWTSDCGGATADGLCPGGSQFKCCDAGQAYGPYDAPAVPEVGSCKAVTVEGTRKIIDAFPGRIWSAGCYREGTCSDGSEHPCGRAIDLMCSDEAGLGSIGCTDIAEWAMNHSAELNMYYVIYGQRIWNSGRDAVGAWAGWRTMEDRASITQNHWDHVHVSFNDV